MGRGNSECHDFILEKDKRLENRFTNLTTQATFAWDVSMLSGMDRAKRGMLDEMHLSFSDMLQQGEFPGDKPNLAMVKWEIHSCVEK